MAAGGNNQRLTSPSCNPLRLAKHAANDRSNFHYCKTFIYELCRCQSTLIFETVKARKKSLWIARGSLPSSGFDHSSTIWYILPPLLCGIIMSECVLDHVWEDGLCKIHSIKCSKLCFCLACSKLCFCLAPAERKVVPPQLRGPLPPLLWVSGWNNPLYNFLCSTATSTVTFHPNTFTCRTSVWNRGSWNLPLSTPSSCLPQSIPDYRHCYA